MTISLPGIELAQPLPGLERAPILARARRQRRRAAASALRFPPKRARARSNAAAASARCPRRVWRSIEIHGQPGIVGQPAHQLLQRGGGLALVAEPVVERDQAAADLDVARRAASAARVAASAPSRSPERVAHPPEHVPFDRARARVRARAPARRACRGCAPPRTRPTRRRAGARVARRSSRSSAASVAATRGAVGRDRRRRCAGAPRAARASQLRGGVPGAQPRLQHRGGRGGLAGALQRVGQAVGDLVALRLGARQLAQQRDGLVLRALVGRVARTGQDRERGVDQAPARGGRRSSFSASSYAASAAARRRRRRARGRGPRAPAPTAARPAAPARTPRPPPSRHPAPKQVRVRGERRVRGAPAVRRRALGARAKPLAQARPAVAARQLDQPPRDIVVVGAFEQRPLGALEQRASNPCGEPPSPRARAPRRRRERAGPMTSARRRTQQKIAPAGRRPTRRAVRNRAQKTGPRRRTIASVEGRPRIENWVARLREATAEAADVDGAGREQAQPALAPLADVVANQAFVLARHGEEVQAGEVGLARRRSGSAARRWPR